MSSLFGVIESQFDNSNWRRVEVVEANIVLRSPIEALQINIGLQGLTLVPLEMNPVEVEQSRFVRGQPTDEEPQ